MQIDRFTHLHFPSSNTPIASDDALSDVTSRTGLSKPPTQSPAPASQSDLVRAESVVLNVQFPGRGVSQASQPVAETYTDGRKLAAGSDPQLDSESQAADHQRAVDRNVGVFTQITLNKDGVLVAKPQPTGVVKQPDFVALAVSAMREFSDEAERQKAQSFDFNVAPAGMPWGRLKSLQQLAARFNVFA